MYRFCSIHIFRGLPLLPFRFHYSLNQPRLIHPSRVHTSCFLSLILSSIGFCFSFSLMYSFLNQFIFSFLRFSQLLHFCCIQCAFMPFVGYPCLACLSMSCSKSRLHLVSLGQIALYFKPVKFQSSKHFKKVKKQNWKRLSPNLLFHFKVEKTKLNSIKILLTKTVNPIP